MRPCHRKSVMFKKIQNSRKCAPMCNGSVDMRFESDKYYILKGEELEYLEAMLFEMQTAIRNIIESKTRSLPDRDKEGRDTIFFHDLF